ncbi:hypothetical protein ACFX13_033655 [Malus domestica]
MHPLVAVGIPGFIISLRSDFHIRMRMPSFDLTLKGFGGVGGNIRVCIGLVQGEWHVQCSAAATATWKLGPWNCP